MFDALFHVAAIQAGAAASDAAGETPRTLLWLLAYVLGQAISIIFVLKLLTAKKAPHATMLWVIVILASPYVGLILYYLFPHRLSLRRIRRRISRLGGLDTEPELRRLGQDDKSLHPIARFLGRLEPYCGADGNALRLLSSGDEFFRALGERIREARTFVHFETYILRPDETGKRLLDLLEQTVRRGVEVRLLYDHFGSWALKDRHVQGLRAAGGHAVSYAPLLWRRRPFTLNLRNHRKLIVVDGDTAFVGGRNVAKEYEDDRFGRRGRWFDAMMEIEGPGVLPLGAVFAEDWFNSTDEDLVQTRYFPRVAPAGTSWVGTVASGPDRRRNSLRYVLFEMIGRARETLDISSPYLVPHPSILTALEAAATRGVRIRLHTNGRKAERFVLYHAARSYYERLIEVGLEIIETEEDYNHAKMFIADGEQLYLGSANLDMRSFELNFEVGVVLLDARICAAATEIFERRQVRGKRVEKAAARIGRFGQVVDGVCRVVSPIL